MKIAALVARLLLGLIFLVFGLNGFLQFIPAPPLPGGLAGQFITVLFQSHYALVVSAFQVAGAVLLLVNRYVPLALTLLGPVIVNILLFHILLYRTGLSTAIVCRDPLGYLGFSPPPELRRPLCSANYLSLVAYLLTGFSFPVPLFYFRAHYTNG